MSAPPDVVSARKPRRRPGLVWGILLAGLLAGCASQPKAKMPPRTGDPVVDGMNQIEFGPEKDKVLWQYRTALACLRRQQYDQARALLDDALSRIEGIYGHDESAREARGTFNAEAKKTFIGEPYERSMAYFYRGILYWMEGEPDNARACFRSGQIHDSDTADKKYAADYVLLDYLEGLASVKLGEDGGDALKRAYSIPDRTVPAPYDTNANVLIFVEFEQGPRKYATGQYGEQLRFRTEPARVHNARVKVTDQSLRLPAYDDLQFQATTRGGRVMDHVLGNKAVFKTTTDIIGTAGIISGAVMAGTSHDQGVQAAGLGLLAVGIFSKVLSAATTPEADTRAWDNLPRFLTFTSLHLPEGDHPLTVEFLDESGIVLANRTKELTVHIPPGPGDQVVYVSDQSVIPKTL